MTFHGWLRGSMSRGKNPQTNKDVSKPGNEVVQGDGKTGMEYKQVKGEPQAAQTIDWEK